MSKIFYDHLVSLNRIEKEINKLVDSKEEKEELWKIIDEYIHHRVLGCILTRLPKDHHEEFLTKFTDTPHHKDLWDYLREKVADDIEDFVRQEVYLIGNELLNVIRPKANKGK